MLRPSELAVPHTLARLLPVLPPAPARLVEVGGGDGALAAALRGRGYDVTVVEPDAASAQACRDRGLAVVQAPVEAFEGGGFGGALFTRVLHSVPDPGAAVRRMAAACAPGGPVVVEDFARDEVDLAAAAFVYDNRAVLAAAGLLPADPAADPATDPLARWREFPIADQHHHLDSGLYRQKSKCEPRDPRQDQVARAELGGPRPPVHPGSVVVAALAGLGSPLTVERTEILWRQVIAPAEGDAARLRPVAEVLRAVEARRIAEGTLPAIGIFAVSVAR